MSKEKFIRNISTHPDISQIGKQSYTSQKANALTTRFQGYLHLEDANRPQKSSFEKYNTPQIMEKEEF